MKKIISLLILGIFSFTLFSCSKDTGVLKDLKSKYPNSQITDNNGIYDVVSDNVDFSEVQTKEAYGESEMYLYDTLELLLDSLNPQTSVIVLGEKTGQSKQYIPVNSKTNLVEGLFYTHSKVKVKKAFYGDVSDGDVITVCEYYAVFNDTNGSKMLYDTYLPLSSEEAIYVLYKNKAPSLFGESEYYDNSIYSVSTDYITNKVTETDKKLRMTKLKSDLYQKYVVNNDTALDRDEEIKKNTEYNSKRGLGALSADELAKIDKLIQKYGEKGK